MHRGGVAFRTFANTFHRSAQDAHTHFMNTWPWTNIRKELEKRSQNAEECIAFVSVDEMIQHIKSIKTPWYVSAYNNIMWTINDWVWSVYRWVRPCHALVRDSIPKSWMDGVELIREVNFAIIKEFYEHESNRVDWSACDEHKEFYQWLQSSYEYITCSRLMKEQELQQAWERVDASVAGAARYAQIDAIENYITQQDDAILTQMMHYRKYFWS